MGLTTTELTPKIGSQLTIDAASLLNGEHAQAIRDLLVERGVLIVRGINFNDDQQRSFTRTLGDLRTGTFTKEGDEGLMAVTMDKRENPAYAEFFPGTFFWHIDGTYEQVPPFATVLTPRVLSPEGGQTEFANTYAAFEGLPKAEQEYLETLKVVHTMVATMAEAVPDASLENFKLWLSYPQPTYPLVWHHKTGRKSLVLSKSCSHIVGMHPADSRALLDRLTAHATQDDYVYRHAWRMGDLLIWDNTGTMHRVRPYDKNSGRRLHRFTLNGEESLATEV
jgi:alpha-ketoglutarate-dependent taurine dioxygenase